MKNEFCLIFGHPISSLFVAFAGVNHTMKTTITKVLHYTIVHGMNCGCLSKSVDNLNHSMCLRSTVVVLSITHNIHMFTCMYSLYDDR